MIKGFKKGSGFKQFLSVLLTPFLLFFLSASASAAAPTTNNTELDDILRMNQKTITMSIGVTDADEDVLSYSLTNSNSSVVSVSQSGDTLTVSPVTDAYGTANIEIAVSDATDTATVNILFTVVTYNLITGTGDDRLDVDEDTDLSITIDDFVSHAGYDFGYTVRTEPSNGSITGSGPGFTYTPSENFNGTDNIRVEIDTPLIDIEPDNYLHNVDVFTTHKAVFVTNNIVFLGSSDSTSDLEGIKIYDHSDPDTLTEIASIEVNRVKELLVSGNYLFVLRGYATETIQVYDISDLNNIGEAISTLNISNGTATDTWDRLDDYLIVGGGSKVYTVDISNPHNISQASSGATSVGAFHKIMVRTVSHGTYMYLAMNDSNDNVGLKRYSLADPLSPSNGESLEYDKPADANDMSGDHFDLISDERYLYTLGEHTGLYIIDMEDEDFDEESVTASRYLDGSDMDRGSNYRGMYLHNKYLYAGRDYGNIDIYDVTDVTNPDFISTEDISNSSGAGTKAIVVSDGYYYQVESGKGLFIHPVSERVFADIAITVNYVEDTPTVSASMSDVEVDEDASVVTFNVSDYFDDVDIPYGDSLSYSVTYNNEAMISIDQSGSYITVNFLEHQHGTDNVTVTAEDAAANTISTSFWVTVNSVNDVPILAVPMLDIVRNMDDNDITYNLNTVFTDADHDLIFTIVQNSNPSLVAATISESDILTLDLQTGMIGTSHFDIYATDGIVSRNNTFKLVVGSNDNWPPIVDNELDDVTTSEDVSVTLSMVDVYSDDDGDVLNYTASVVVNSDILTVTVNSSVLTLNTVENMSGIASVEIYANDGTIVTTETITVTINAVNDSPVFTSSASLSSTENQIEVVTISSYDVEGSDLNFAILSDGSNDSALFGIDADTGVVTVSTTLDYENPTDTDVDNDYEFVVSISDEEYTVTQAMTVTVLDTNDAPQVNVERTDITLRRNQLPTTRNSGIIDQDGDPVTYTILNNNTDLLTINQSGHSLGFTVAEDSIGSADITVNVKDDSSESVTINFTVVIVSYNSIVVPDYALDTNEDTDLEQSISAWAEYSLTYTVSDAPDNGSVSFSGNSYTYTPNDQFTGTDRFTVAVETPVHDYDIDSTTSYRLDKENPSFSNDFCLYVHNNLLFVGATNSSGSNISIYDHGNPDDLVEIGSIEETKVRELWVTDNYLFVIRNDDDETVVVYDISDVDDIGEAVSTINLNNSATDAFDVSGNYMYVSGGTKLNVLDISDPRNISLASDANLTVADHHVIQVGNGYVYLGRVDSGYAAVTRYALSSATTIGSGYTLSYNTTGSAQDTDGHTKDILLYGDYLFMIDEEKGLAVLDAVADTFNSTSTVLKKPMDGGADFMDMYLHNQYLYVAQDNGEIRVYDITDPDSPSYEDEFDVSTGSDGRDLQIENGYLYQLDKSQGVSVFPIHERQYSTVAVTVNYVEDNPHVGQNISDILVDEDNAAITLNLSEYLTDYDLGYDDSLTYTVTHNNELMLDLELSGDMITINFLAHKHGTDNITVTAEDESGNTVSDAFWVTVNSVNDLPIVANPIGFTTENMNANDITFDLNTVFTDADHELTFTIVENDNPNLVNASISESDILTLDLGTNMIGTSILDIYATDGIVSRNTRFRLAVGSNDNWPPFVDNELDDVETDEDVIVTMSMVAVYSDLDNDALVYSAAVVENSDILTVTVNSSIITFNPVLHANGLATVEVYASDGELITTESIIVTINAINDAPVFSSLATFNVTENLTTIHTLVAPNVDGDTLTYNIVSNGSDDSGLFTLDQSTGLLTVSTAFDYELPTDANSDGVYEFDVTVEDDEYTDSQSLEITILDENDAPVVSDQLPDFAIRMNDSTITKSIGVTDQDGDSLTYTISDTQNGNLVTLSNDGDVLSLSTIFNVTGNTHITINVEDEAGVEVVTTFNLEVAQYNLITVSDQSPTTDEDTAIAVEIDDAVSWGGYSLEYSVYTQPSYGTLSGSDGSYTYTPTTDYNGSDTFTIVVDTLVDEFDIDVNSTSPLVSLDEANDYETVYVTGNTLFVARQSSSGSNHLKIYDHSDPSSLRHISTLSITKIQHLYVIDHYLFVLRQSSSGTVRVYDISDLSNITLLDADIDNSKGSYLQNWSFSNGYLYLGADMDGETSVAVVDVSDPTDISEVMFGSSDYTTLLEHKSILAHDGYLYLGREDEGSNSMVRRYTISSSTGKPSSSGYSSLTGTDFDGDNVDMAIHNGYLYVLNDDRGPVIIDVRDGAFSKVAKKSTHSDLDRGSIYDNVFVHNNFLYGARYLGETDIWDITDPSEPVYKDSWDLAINSNDGDTEEIHVHNGYIYYLDDDAGLTIVPAPARSLSQVTVTVNYVEDSPTVTVNMSDIQVDEDSSVSTLNVAEYFADADIVYGDSLSYSVTHNNETMLTVELTDTIMTINYLFNQNGTDNITVTAEDEAGNTVSEAFWVTVNNVNDSPVIAEPMLDITRNMNASDVTYNLNTVFTDLDSDLTFTIVQNSNSSLISATISESEILTLELTTDMTGTSHFDIAATDGYVTKNNIFKLIVGSDTNWPPVVDNEISDIAFDEDTVATASMVAVYSDLNSEDTLTYTASVVENSDILTVLVDSTTLTLNAVENQYGVAIVEVYANDGTIVTTETITVTINAVNDAPVFSSSAELDVTENQLNLATVVASDVESDTLTFNIVSDVNDDSALFSIDASTGVLSVSTELDYENATDLNTDNDYVLDITVEDAEYVVTQTFTLTVTDTNDAPSVNTVLGDITRRMNGQTITRSIGVVDQDGDSLSYTISIESLSGDDPIVSLSNNGDVLTISTVEDAYGTAFVTINVTDTNSASSTITFNMTVVTYNLITVSDVTTSTFEDTAVNISISDAELRETHERFEDTTLGYSISSAPSNGSLTGDSGSYSYTPTSEFVGTDTFTVAIQSSFTFYDPDLSFPDPTMSHDDLAKANAIAITGNYVFVGNEDGSSSKIRLYDHADPSELVYLSELSSNASVEKLLIHENYLYVLRKTGTNTVQVYDIGELPNVSALIDEISVPNSSNSDTWDVDGNYLYVGGNTEVNVLDISDPTNLSLALSNQGTTDEFHALKVHNGYLYLALEDDGDTDGVRRYTISSGPSLSSASNKSGNRMANDVYDLQIVGDYLYLLDETDGITIFDTSDYSLHMDKDDYNYLDPGGNLRYLYLEGDFLYASHYNGNVRTYDVSDPSDPVIYSETPSGTEYRHVDLSIKKSGSDTTDGEDLIISDGYVYHLSYDQGVEWGPKPVERSYATVTVTVNFVNDAPEVSTSFDDVLVNEDANDITFNVSEYFTDPDVSQGDSLTYSFEFSNEDLITVNQDGALITINFLENQNGTTNFNVIATDDGGLIVSDNFMITVNALTDPLLVLDLPNVAVLEDASDSTITLTDYLQDVDNPEMLTYTVTSNSNQDLVTTSISNGVLTLEFLADQNGTSNILIYATNDVVSATENILVTVNAVDDVPVVSSIIPSFSVLEDSNDTTRNISEVFTDADSQTLTLSAAVVSNSDLVSVTADQNILTLSYTADDNGVADIEVYATDGTTTVTHSFRVTVNAVDDAPVIIDPGFVDRRVSEDATAVTIDLSTIFEDIDGDTLTYALSANTNETVVTTSISDGDLVLTFIENQFGEATIELEASAEGKSVTDDILLTVESVNDAPEATSTDSVTITENETEVLTVTGTDVETDPVTFNISGGVDSELFEIDVNTGALAFSTAPDYENPADNGENNNYVVVVGVSDGEVITTYSVSITVTDIEDSLVISGTPDGEVDEDELYSFTPTATAAEDDTFEYSILNQPSWATFSTTNGQLTGTPDNDDVGTYADIEIGVSTDTERVSLNMFTITVNAIDDAPVVIDPGFVDRIVSEDASDVTVNLSSIFEDVDSDSIAYSVISNTAALVVTTSISEGIITFNFLENMYGTAVLVVEASADNKSVTDDIIITVNSINDLPVITGTAGSSVDEDSTYTFTPSATDVDGDTLEFSIINLPSWASFSTSNGSLSGTPVSANVGDYTDIEIAVSDGTDTVSLNVFDIAVNFVNDAPVINGSPDTNVDEDVEYTFLPVATDEENDDLEFSILNLPSWASFSTENGLLSGTPVSANEGEYTGIEIAVSDGTTTVSLNSFSIEVLGINDAPTINGSPDSSVDEDTVYSFTPIASDEEDDDLEFSILNLPSWASFSTVNGTLSGTPVSANVGFYDAIEIAVTDGNTTVSLNAFSITVNFVDDAPEISGSPDTSVSEDSLYSFTPTASDEEGDTLTFSILFKPDWASFNTETGALTGTPDNDDTGEYTDIEIAVSDGASVVSLNSFTITVDAVDDAPQVIDPGFSDLNVDEDSSDVTVDLTEIFEDVDSETVVYTVTANTNDSVVSVSIATNTLTVEFIEDAFGTALISVEARADGKYVTDNFLVTVNNIDDAPRLIGDGFSDKTVLEGTESWSLNLSTVFEDIDSDSLSFTVNSNDNEDLLTASISGSTLTVSFVDDMIGTANIDVEAEADNKSVTDDIRIVVTNVNDAPEITSTDSVSVSENSTAVLTVVGEDLESSSVTYSIVSGTHADLFDMDTNSGVLVFSEAPNYEEPAENSNNVYSLTVGVGDGLATTTQDITVTVVDVNESPYLSAAVANYKVFEDALATTITVSDIFADPEDDSLVYAASVKVNSDLISLEIDSDTLTVNYSEDESGIAVFQLTATDGEFTVTDTVKVTVNAVNDIPVFISSGTASVSENETAVMTVVGEDVEDSSVTYSIVSGTHADLFSIGESSGELLFSSAPDYESPAENSNNNYIVILGLGDGFVTVTQSVTVTVSDVNESPVVSDPEDDLLVSEDADAVSITVSDAFSDPDSGDTLSYDAAIVSNSDLISIDLENAVLTINFTENASGTAVIETYATDGEFTVTDSIIITVNAVNDFPEITSDDSVSVSENTTSVLTVEGSDLEVNTLSYSLEGGAHESLFEIDSSTGALVFASAPNFENPAENSDNSYVLVVGVSDSFDTSTQSVTVTVVDVNESPVVSSPEDDLLVSEDADAVAIIVSDAFSDPDSGDTLSYDAAIVSNSDLISIDLENAVLTINFTENASGTAVIETYATDGEFTVTDSITITVNAINDFPEITSDDSVSVSENTTSVLTVEGSDLEENTLSYSLEGGAHESLFEIDSSTGALVFASAPNFENPAENSDNSYVLVVGVSDSFDTSTQSVTVTVVNVNESPVVSSPEDDLLVSEDADAVAIIVSDAFSDPDSGDTLSYDAAIVSNSDLISIDLENAVLTINFTENASGTAVIETYATDGEFTVTDSFVVTVNMVNDLPEFTSDDSVSVSENTTVVMTVQGEDLESSSLTYSFEGGTHESLFEINENTGALAFIDAPDFENPADNSSNTYLLTVGLSDSQGISTTDITVTVVDVNEQPVVTSNSIGVLVDEDAETSEYDLSTVFSDPELDSLSFEASIVSNSDLISIDTDGTVVEISYASDGNGVAVIEISASDDEYTVTDSLTVTVNPVDDAPRVIGSGFSDKTVFEDSDDLSISLSSIFEDIDSDGISYRITDNTDSSEVGAEIEAGALVLSFGENQFGTAIIEVEASADSKVVTDNIAVTVKPVNDGPEIMSTDSVTVSENVFHVLTVVGEDVESSVVTYSIEGGIDSDLFEIEADSGVLSFVTAANFEQPFGSGDNVYLLSIGVSDGEIISTQDLTVTVLDINESPVATANSMGFVVDEDADPSELDLSEIFEDEDLDTLNFEASVLDNENLVDLSIDGETLLVTFAVDLNGVSVIELSASDLEYTVTKAVVITVNAVDDAPRFIDSGFSDISVMEDAESVSINLATIIEDIDSDEIVFTVDDISNETVVSMSISDSTLLIDFKDDAVGVSDVTILAVADEKSLSDTFEITVGSINDLPEIISSDAVSVSENLRYVFDVLGDDLETESVTYSIRSGDDMDLFELDLNSGALYFLVTPNYEAAGDSNGDNSYSLVVSVSDGEDSVTQALTVTVLDINDAPVISGSPETEVDEDVSYSFIPESSDEDGDNLVFSVSQLPSWASFSSETGTLSGTPGNDDSGTYEDIVISVYDGTVTVNLDAFSITVDPINDLPEVIGEGISDITVDEDADYVTWNLNQYFRDIDGDALSYAVDSVEESSLIQVRVSKNRLRVVFKADQHGESLVTISAQSGSDLIYDSFKVTVEPVNDMPEVIGDGLLDRVVSEDADAISIGLLDYFVDVDGQSYSFAVEHDNSDLLVAEVDGSTLNLSFISDHNGLATVSVSVSTGSDTITDAFLMSVNAVNDAPYFVSTPNATITSNQRIVSGAFVVEDIDSSHLRYSIVGGADAEQFTIHESTGLLQSVDLVNYVAPSDDDSNGVYELFIGIHDDSLVSTAAITITVVSDPDTEEVIVIDEDSSVAVETEIVDTILTIEGETELTFEDGVIISSSSIRIIDSEVEAENITINQIEVSLEDASTLSTNALVLETELTVEQDEDSVLTAYEVIGDYELTIDGGSAELNSIEGDLLITGNATLGSVDGEFDIDVQGNMTVYTGVISLDLTKTLSITGRLKIDYSRLIITRTVLNSIQSSYSYLLSAKQSLSSTTALAKGDSFTVLSVDEIEGEFESVELPELGDGLEWDISQLYKTGVIEVISSVRGATAIEGGALAFPNPMSLLSDTKFDIGFEINYDTTVTVYLYDMLGRLQIRKDVSVTSDEYNRISIWESDFPYGRMSAGIYFFIVEENGVVLSKGKVGITP